MTQESSSGGTATTSPPQICKRHRDTLPLNDTAWFGSFIGGLERGGIYLLGGPPGARKSGLVLQLALDLARQGIKSLFLLTEEPATRLYDRAASMMSDCSADDLLGGLAHLSAEENVPPMRELPAFVRREILSADGNWRGRDFRLAVIDSAQARGLSAAATRDYAGLIEAAHLMASAGMTVVVISHLTKSGRFAGPATVEHALDAALLLKPTSIGRALFVTKNRFGVASATEPLLLDLDDVTLRLSPSKNRGSRLAYARTYARADFENVVDVQAFVTVAPHGARGRLAAPGMPRGEIHQLLGIISRAVGTDLRDGGFFIDLRIPGCRRYLKSMQLAFAVAIVGAYLRLPMPDGLFIGEVDLAGAIRPFEMESLNQLTADVESGVDLTEPRPIYCHPATGIAFLGSCRTHLRYCQKLEQVLWSLWPSLR